MTGKKKKPPMKDKTSRVSKKKVRKKKVASMHRFGGPFVSGLRPQRKGSEEAAVT